MTRILVFGRGKTGTTALFYRIKNARPEIDLPTAYEPTPDEITGKEWLVKAFKNCASKFGDFDKRVFIVRDPRDRAISEILWRFSDLYERRDEVLELLRQKEADPHSVSLKSLHDLHETTYVLTSGNVIDLHEQYDHCLIRYEDFVQGKWQNVEDYLGFSLEGPDNIAEGCRAVTRSKRAGNWRNWMTPADVVYFRPIFGRYMDYFGYVDDWELAADPAIEARFSSEYVESLMDIRQRLSQ